LAGRPLLTILNRFDAGDALHRDNRAWLQGRDRLDVVTTVDELAGRLR